MSDQWFRFFYHKMDFDKQKSTDFAAQHAAIDFEVFDKWFRFFYFEVDFLKQESLDLAKQHLDTDFTAFQEWFQYFYFNIDHLCKKDTPPLAFKHMHLDLDQAKKVKDFLYYESEYSRSDSAKLALEENWYTIDVEAVKKLKAFFYDKTDLSKSDSFKQAVECVHFDFEEFERKRNGLRTLDGICKVIEEMKSERLAQEMAKLQVKQDTYRSGTKVEAFWEDHVNSNWNGWYLATIVSRQNDKWSVQYDQFPQWGDCETKAENVRFPVGAKVQAFWKDSECEGWFAATVSASNAKGYLVKYNDYPHWGDCQTDKQNVRN